MAAREAKHEPTVFKTELEVLQIEKCYADALSSVAPNLSTKGLSALEYCTMCIYYDSQPYPAQFLITNEEENEGPDDKELDHILTDLQEETKSDSSSSKDGEFAFGNK